MPVSDPTVSTASGESATPTIATPTYAADDQLIAWVGFAGGTGVTVTPPAGWNLVDRQDYLTQLGLAVYQKKAGTEPANQTWTLSASQKWTGGMASYPGGGAIAINTGRADQYGVRNFQTAPLTTNQADSRVIAIAIQGSPSSYTAPTDWTVRGQERSGASNKGDISSALIDRTQATPGAVPAATLTAAVGTSALLVSSSDGATRTTDPSVKPQDALISLGFTDILIVDNRTAAATMLQQSNDRDVTVILGEVSSGRVGTKLVSSSTAIFNLEIGLFDEFQMATTFTAVANQDSLTIRSPAHPIANGLTGTIQASALNDYYFGAAPLAPGLESIASLVDDASQSVLFAAEKGASLLDASQSPARQVHCGVHENTANWTADFQTLLEGAIDYCARNGPSPQIVTMLELPEAGGVVVNEAVGTGAITLPAVEAAGEGAASNVIGSGAIALPQIEISGQGTAINVTGQGAVTLPSLEVSGEGTAGVIAGAGNIALPMVEVAGIGTAVGAPAADEAVGSGDIALPQIEVSGEGTAINVVGAGAIALPSPTVRGAGTAGISQEARGTGNITLPTPIVQGQGRSITLPTVATRTPPSRTMVVRKEKRVLTLIPQASPRSSW